MAVATDTVAEIDLPGFPSLRGFYDRMAELGDPATIDRVLAPHLGRDWQGVHPDILLRDVMDLLGRDEVEAARKRVWGVYHRQGISAQIEGLAVPFDTVASNRFRLRRGALRLAVGEAQRGVIEVRCEHQDSVACMVGHLTELTEVVADGVHWLRFRAVLHAGPLAVDIADQVDRRLQSGEGVGVSVGLSTDHDQVRTRQEGVQEYLEARLEELSLCDHPRFRGARVENLTWCGRHATEARLWRLRRTLARAAGPPPGSVKRPAQEPEHYRVDAQTFQVLAPKHATLSPIASLKREKIAAAYSAWRGLMSDRDFQLFVTREVEADGRLR